MPVRRFQNEDDAKFVGVFRIVPKSRAPFIKLISVFSPQDCVHRMDEILNWFIESF